MCYWFLEHGSSSASHHQSHNHNRLSQSSYHSQYNQATSVTASVVSAANTQSSVGSGGKYVGQSVSYSSSGGKSSTYHKDDTKSSSNVPHYSSNNYHNHHQPSYDQESGYISKRASNYDNDESYAPSSSYRGKGLSASSQSNSDWSQRRRRRKDDEVGSGGASSGGRGNSISGNNSSHVNYGGGHHTNNTTYSSHSTTSQQQQQQNHHSQQQSHNAANKAPTSATPIVATTIQPSSPQPTNGVTSIPPLMRDISNSNNQSGSISASISGGSTGGINNNATSASVTATTVPATTPANANISAASTINRAFDLEQSAFPPLPGLVKRDEKSSQATQTGNQTATVGAQSHATGSVPLTGYANTAGGVSGVQGKGPQLPNVSGSTLDAGIPIVDVVPAATSGAWGENRLADVVKGTAKTTATTTASSATTTTSPSNTNISKKSEPSRIESPPPLQHQQIPITPTTPHATINFDNSTTSSSSSQSKTTQPSNITTTTNTTPPQITNDPATLSTVTMTPPFSPETTTATHSNNNHNSNSKTSPPVIKSSTTIIASAATAAVDKVTKTEVVMVNGMDSVNNTEITSASSVAPLIVDNKTMSVPQQKASKNTAKVAAAAITPQTGFNATLSPPVSLPTPAASPSSPQTSHDPSAPAPKLSYAQVAHSFTAAAVKEENNNNNNMSNHNTTDRERTISEKENSVGNRKKDLTSPPNSRVNSQQRGKFLINN